MEPGANALPARPIPALDEDSVHLWRLPYERHRGRQPLLGLLGAYLGRALVDQDLRNDGYGRPSLCAPGERLQFNWSHSGTVALVALGLDVPTLGVDVEVRRARRRVLPLAQRYFAAAEVDALAEVEGDLRAIRFLQLWTAKEAVLKGLGRGLAYGLDRVAFTLSDGRPTPAAFDGDVGAPRAWQVVSGEMGEDIISTLAWRGAPRRIQRFRAPWGGCGTSADGAGP